MFLEDLVLMTMSGQPVNKQSDNHLKPFCWAIADKLDVTKIIALSKSEPNEFERAGFCVFPLHIEPSKGKPLSPYAISKGNRSTLDACRKAFVAGVKFAEKEHGILE
jgi:hypothetical protein